MNRLFVTGLSHKTAPIDVREKLAHATKPIERVLSDLLKLDGIDEALVVSTCNRVEIYVEGGGDDAQQRREIRDYLVRTAGLRLDALEPHLYDYAGPAALRHLFRVAASLDSMVLGEPQILGQVKQAYHHGVTAQSVGPRLGRVFERAFSVAKRVRTETGIAENAVSMSFAAVELGRDIFSSLSGTTVLVIGAGKMSTLAAKHLRNNGVSEIRVANRSIERATRLAKEIGGTASSLNDLELLLQRADIVISSTAAPGYVVDKKLMSKVVRHRRYRPILFVDIAVPRDIDPELEDLENVFVYDVDDLESVVHDNREARSAEASAAQTIIDSEILAYAKWHKSQQVVPVIKALRAHAMSIAEAEFQRTMGSTGSLPPTDPKVAKRVRAMSQAIVNKLLHPALTTLKQAGADGDPAPLADALKQLFALDVDADPKPAAEEKSNVVPFSKKEDVG